MRNDGQPDWEAIAAYVRGVAEKAFWFGYGTAEMEFLPAASSNYEARRRAAQLYVASSFDVETIKQFHPLGLLPLPPATDGPNTSSGGQSSSN